MSFRSFCLFSFCLVVYFVWAFALVGCASNRRPVVSSLPSADPVPLSFENESEISFPSLEIDIESSALKVGEVVGALADLTKTSIVVSSVEVADSVFAGKWSDSAVLISEVCTRYDLRLILRESHYVLVPAADQLVWVVWSWPGDVTTDAQQILSSLKLCETIAVTNGGVCVLGVRSDRADRLRSVLQQLDGSSDWLVQITIVDSWVRGGVFAGLNTDALELSDGGWTAASGDVVDSYLLAVREGAERVQRFGSRVPYQSSHVTENGQLIAGEVTYQEIRSEVAVTVSTTTAGAQARVRVLASDPDAVLDDGLMRVSYEELDSLISLRSRPVLVGKVSKWRESRSFDMGRILELIAGRELRRYEVWVHAVRVNR